MKYNLVVFKCNNQAHQLMTYDLNPNYVQLNTTKGRKNTDTYIIYMVASRLFCFLFVDFLVCLVLKYLVLSSLFIYLFVFLFVWSSLCLIMDVWSLAGFIIYFINVCVYNISGSEPFVCGSAASKFDYLWASVFAIMPHECWCMVRGGATKHSTISCLDLELRRWHSFEPIISISPMVVANLAYKESS